MLKPVIFRLTLIAGIITLMLSQSQAQMSNRQWWNSLSPAWKKVFYIDQFKGKEIEPSDEDLERVVKTKRINCSKNKEITDLKPLSQLALLERIKCSDCPALTGLEGIENLTNLQELDCSNNDNISSLKPIELLTGLKRLNCGNTMVKNLRPLLNLSNLEDLDIHFATINELIFIKNLKNLTKLDVSDNATLYSIEGVEGLANLMEFDCSNTDIEDLTPLQNSKSLKILDISTTQVNNLRPLQTVKTLQELNCTNSKVRTLRYLYSHTNLIMVAVRGTLIPKDELKIAKEALLRVVAQPTNFVFDSD
ncbi:MAG: leucine-rich repeat domain-containing protein [Bacteroidales bacterium]